MGGVCGCVGCGVELLGVFVVTLVGVVLSGVYVILLGVVVWVVGYVVGIKLWRGYVGTFKYVCS